MARKLKGVMIALFLALGLAFAVPPASASVEYPLTGDIDGNGMVDLRDAVLGLRILAGGTLPPAPGPGALLTDTGRIGIAEALYVLQRLAGARATPNYLSLRSDPGDQVGQGRSYLYTEADAAIEIEARGNHLTLVLSGDEQWQGEFKAPATQSRLQAGTYAEVRRYPLHDQARGGLDWSGQGRGCNELTGWFALDRVLYVEGVLQGIDLRFEQHCEGETPALRGQLHWSAAGAAEPAGPVDPPPAGLWRPEPGATPATGSFVYLQSGQGDAVGQGGAYTYTPADAVISLGAAGNRLAVSVVGSQSWYGDFTAMSSLDQLQPGYYGRLRAYPLHNPARGGLAWSGSGRSCSALEGWFVVDSVSYIDGVLDAVDLRFEQRCEGSEAPLHGRIRWVSGTPRPTGPAIPPPEGLWQPDPGAMPSGLNYVYLESEYGDPIGQGRIYTYTQADARFSVTAAGNLLGIKIEGDEEWSGTFQAMSGLTQLQPGFYNGLGSHFYFDAARGRLSWSGPGYYSCSGATGWVVVDSVAYEGDTLTAIDLRFEQYCDGRLAAFRGKVHWRADDPTLPPWPIDPPPAWLWQPEPGTMPASGSYVYLESDPGDTVGGGGVFTYTEANAGFSVGEMGNLLRFDITGEKIWSGYFQGPDALDRLKPGFYGPVPHYSASNPVKGGLLWSLDHGDCRAATGWFAVDSVSTVDGVLASLDLRFEQRCQGSTAALRGKIHWEVPPQAFLPPGPIDPPPEGLWQPEPGTTPGSGNFIHLVKRGWTASSLPMSYTYTQADAVISVRSLENSINVNIAGDESWSGHFRPGSGLDRLQPGFYGIIEAAYDPDRGGFSWSQSGSSCGSYYGRGWFVVDNIAYEGNTLTALDLRFELRCEGWILFVRGQIHWRAGDPTGPPGPIDPPPAGLWQPASGAVPASGNYIYFKSDAGEPEGQGLTYTYTPADADIAVGAGGNQLSVIIRDDIIWSGNFKAMYTLERLAPGYYGALKGYPSYNETKGGLSWWGSGSGYCDDATGWFAVDRITYVDGVLGALDLRFEQRCGGRTPALHGQIHWEVPYADLPAGPVAPPPEGLWQPAAGATPASGNHVHLQSDAGDYIGAGKTFTYTHTDAVIRLEAVQNTLSVTLRGEGDEYWSGNFRTRDGLARFEPGFYGLLNRYISYNPARGGLDWSGQGRGCNAMTGWFVVDSVTYEGDSLTAIDLRFEQHCDGRTPALHGRIRWTAEDAANAPRPIDPPPAGLWRAAADAVPASGNYVYLQSEPGEYIGEGGTYTYTPPQTSISASASGTSLIVQLKGPVSWLGHFQAMGTIDRLQPGYYGDLQIYRPFANPVGSYMDWEGLRYCYSVAGWFVVDSIAYEGEVLQALDLRFEQRCNSATPALHGQIHWVR